MFATEQKINFKSENFRLGTSSGQRVTSMQKAFAAHSLRTWAASDFMKIKADMVSFVKLFLNLILSSDLCPTCAEINICSHFPRLRRRLSSHVPSAQRSESRASSFDWDNYERRMDTHFGCGRTPARMAENQENVIR